jgi:hypothetical protein
VQRPIRHKTHERFDRDEAVRIGSERAFGIVFAAVFALFGSLSLMRGTVYWLALYPAAGAFLLAAFLAPRMLAPLNQVWFRVGLAMHKIVSPAIMALLFYLAVTPTGLIMRLLGRDLLRLRRKPDALSHWIRRDPPGPSGDSMRNQF